MVGFFFFFFFILGGGKSYTPLNGWRIVREILPMNLNHCHGNVVVAAVPQEKGILLPCNYLEG